ncbi:MAG: GNAT family N-acetyltransferase [Hyphomicrobiales bacterium]|nr:GNAT family N-acetyltransferase [Hyphomicrobiales bacterium]
MQFAIRRFQPADLDALQRIRARAFAPIFASFRRIVGDDIAAFAFAEAERDQARLLHDICRPGAAHQVFVAEAQGSVIGFVSLSLDASRATGEIGLNAVDPDLAGRGVGAQLYDMAIQTMQAAGMNVAVVGAGADASHAPALRAYEKAGFKAGIPSFWLYRTL